MGWFIFKLIVIAATLAGWNESRRAKNQSPRYWRNETTFKPDSLIKQIGDTVYIVKLRKQ